LLLALLLAGPALADTVVTTDGRRLEGTVTERDGKIVVSPKKGIEIILDKSEIDRIEAGSSVKEDFAKKKADLVPGDPEPRYALAQWCKEKGLLAEQKQMLEDVIRLAPDHAQARRDLGYVKDGDQWITEDDLRKKLGFEKVNGKWVPAADAKRARRAEEIRKLLLRFALVWPHQDQKATAARAELDALEKEDPTLVGPLVEERLGEHDATVRFALVVLLGKAKAKASAPRLVALTFQDDDRDVRIAAAKSAWQCEDVGARTAIVQSLFNSKKVIRERAADALDYIQDPETIPYLMEALYLVAQTQVEVEDAPISRSFGGVAAEGNFGGYWITAGSVAVETRYVYLYSKKALAALKRMTGKDFDFSKHDWFEWWKTEGHDKFAKPAPAKPAAQPDPK
jgi:hypothetical protein